MSNSERRPVPPTTSPNWSRRLRARLAAPRTFLLDDRSFALLLACWAASRLLYWVLGVSFDIGSLEQAYQFVHVDLLEHDLWTSVWHLHSQPPLFNAFLGLLLQLPLDPGLAFGIVFRLLGLGLVVVMYRLALTLGVARPVAAASVGVFTCSPASVLWENYLFYTLPVAALLTTAAYSLLRFLRTDRAVYGACFGLAISALALIRATYHLVWVAAAVAFVFWAARGRVAARRLALMLLPTLLVPGLYLKNAVLFDTFSASSWMGLNLARVTLMQADPDRREDLIDAGVLSERARINAFEDLDTFGVDHEPTGVATLDRRWRGDPAIGDPNLNNLDYVEISRGYRRDALAYLRRNPGEYAGTVVAALRLYFLPTSFYTFTRANRAEIDGLSRAGWIVVDWQPRPYDDLFVFLQPKQRAASWTQLAWSSIAAYGIVLVAWPLALLRGRRARRKAAPDSSADRPRDGPDRAARLTLVFVSTTVAFALVASVTLELGENNRFRFETDPVVWVAATALVATRGRALLARVLSLAGRRTGRDGGDRAPLPGGSTCSSPSRVIRPGLRPVGCPT